MRKTVIVTGAGRGLGFAIVQKLLHDGFYVVAVSRTETDEIKDLTQANDNLEFLKFDLEKTRDIFQLCKDIVQSTKLDNKPTIFSLINNAAIGTDGILGTMHETDIERMIAINITAPILLTKYLTRMMMLSGHKGRIVNIGSIIGSTGYSGLSVYGATKSAMEGFSRSLSREIGKIGMTVNVVAPGYMETEMTTGLEGDKLDSIRRRSAMKLFARPSDVAETVAFLLGKGGDRITGTVLTVDAGSTA
ncbi:MAG: SDR family oxidoreductase [Robiginitomaculum sp.]|nr:SDR family oxidoreductase [Robiginitomaculum sp.]